MTEAIRHGRRPGRKITSPAVGQPSTTQGPFDAAAVTRAQTKQTRQMRYGAGSGRENKLFFHRTSAVRGGNLLYVCRIQTYDTAKKTLMKKKMTFTFCRGAGTLYQELMTSDPSNYSIIYFYFCNVSSAAVQFPNLRTIKFDSIYGNRIFCSPSSF